MATCLQKAINACIKIEANDLLKKIENKWGDEGEWEDVSQEEVIENSLKFGIEHKVLDNIIENNESYIALITKIHDILKAGVFDE